MSWGAGEMIHITWAPWGPWLNPSLAPLPNPGWTGTLKSSQGALLVLPWQTIGGSEAKSRGGVILSLEKLPAGKEGIVWCVRWEVQSGRTWLLHYKAAFWSRGTFIAWEACRLQLKWLWQVSGRAGWWGAASQGSGCQFGNEGGGSWGGAFTVLRLTLLRQEGDPAERGAACFPASQGQCSLRCPHLRLCLTSPMFGHPLSTPSFLKPSPLSLNPLSASLFLWKLQIIFHWGQPLSPRLPSCRYGCRDFGAPDPGLARWSGDPVQ